MARLPVLLILCSVVIAIPVVHGVVLGPKAVEEWFQKLKYAKEKVTKLHFYFHDTITGKDPTSLMVAQSNITSTSPTAFGFINMADDPLTAGPEPTSKLVGRAQGIFGSADFKELGFLMTLNFVFTEGKYNGSTLSVLGRNPILHKYREMPIVGGTGVFRLARGIATAQSYTFNITSKNAIVEYHVVVIHY